MEKQTSKRPAVSHRLKLTKRAADGVSVELKATTRGLIEGYRVRCTRRREVRW